MASAKTQAVASEDALNVARTSALFRARQVSRKRGVPQEGLTVKPMRAELEVWISKI